MSLERPSDDFDVLVSITSHSPFSYKKRRRLLSKKGNKLKDR